MRVVLYDKIKHKSSGPPPAIPTSRSKGSRQRVDLHLQTGPLQRPVIVGKLHPEIRVGHSRWVDQQAVEDVKLRGHPLRAVEGRSDAVVEAGLNEGLHLAGVGERKGRVGPESDKDIVGVDIDFAHLAQ